MRVWSPIVSGRARYDCHDLEPGDAVVVAPGERHWHGAVPGSADTHIAVNVNAATTWMEPVNDEEYAG